MPVSSFATKLNDYLDAAYPLLAVETHEEMRVIPEIRQVVANRTYCPDQKKPKTVKPVVYAEWDVINGLIKIPLSEDDKEGPSTINGMTQPHVALSQIGTWKESTVVVMKDVHPFIEVPPVWRTIRNIIGVIKEAGITIIFVSSRFKVPSELAKEVQMVDYRMPNRDELKLAFMDYMDNNVKSRPGYEKFQVEEEFLEGVSESAMGMTTAEADNAFALATISSSRRGGKVQVDQDFVNNIFAEKIANLKNSSLDYRPTKAGFESVGGLELVKAWAMRRRQGFSEEARKLRLPYPKGVLLAGIKGCGKTTVAQAIAHQFGFPLFMFDMGKLFASKVGESEALTREAIRLMESLGRAVVLIDELEKSLGSQATSGGGDSGTSSRMFGTLVSWLSLKTVPVFVIGTLNDFEKLPSELMRKGRFDEVFWVDLPQESERVSIFNALLRHKFRIENYKLEDTSNPLVEATRDFSGAEIEATIEEALYGLLENPKTGMEELLLTAAKTITPQAQLDPEAVKGLRKKAEAFKPASLVNANTTIALPPTKGSRRKVNLN